MYTYISCELRNTYRQCCLYAVTCEESAYGCCVDGVSTALGPGLEGCPETGTVTSETTITAEMAPVTPETIPVTPEPLILCGETQYGCCPDGVSAANGPHQEGCQHPSSVTKSDCDLSAYGCCLDGVAEAQGPNFDGCDNKDKYMITCFDSPYGCCPNGITPASGPHNIGCPSRMTRGGMGCYYGNASLQFMQPTSGNVYLSNCDYHQKL